MKSFIKKNGSRILASLGLAATVINASAEVMGPGWYNKVLMVQTGEVAEVQTPAVPMAMSSMIATPITHQGQPDAITDEIRELACGLRHDPFEIYDYVHNKVDYVPYFGLLKGATLTLLDGCGNDFDQAALLFALLTESGYSPEYQCGSAVIPKAESSGYDLQRLFGVEEGMIPWVLGSCGLEANSSIDIFGNPAWNLWEHVWIEVQINSKNYRFDPSFKRYWKEEGTSWEAAMGYSQAGLLTAAGGTDHVDYTQNIDTNSLYSHLAARSGQLLSEIGLNHANAEPIQVLGGYIRQETVHNQSVTWLPYSSTVSNSWGWGEFPDGMTAKMRFQCNGIDITLSTAELHGRRLAFSFDASNRAQLWLDDILLDTESSSIGATASLVLTIDHPYAALNGEHCDQTETKEYKRGGVYAILYNFGGSSKGGHLKKRQQQLDVYREQGLAEDSRQIRSESLNVMGLDWLKQIGMSDLVINRPADTLAVHHHRVGRMGQETSYYVDVGLDLATCLSRSDSHDDSDAAFRAAALFHSAMEHGVLEQLQGADKPGVSTIRAFELANRGGYKIYQLNSGNYSSYQGQLATTYPSSMMTEFQTRINQGDTLVLPASGNLAFNDWSGYGYIVQSGSAMGMMISGGLSGGFGTIPGTVESGVVQNVYASADNYYYTEPASGSNPRSLEPVDLASGAYLYDALDLSFGGSAPRGIVFKRSYNSLRNKADSVLGNGWRHSFESGITRRTNVDAAFGKTTPQAAATMMTAAYACLDLMKNTTRAKEWVTASMIAHWATDQLLENSVAVQLGEKTFEFIEQPDGSFLSPAGITASLSVFGGNYVLQERNGKTFTFNADQKLSSITDPDGNTLSISHDTDLRPTTVTDTYGRTLTLHYQGGILDKISDSSGREVDYAFDPNGDLVSCADPEGHTVGFTYDTDHRMTVLRNEKNEVIAQNVYNGQNQVEMQYAYGDTNQTWRYAYSGFKTVETTPEGGETVYRFDGKGRQVAVEDALGNTSTISYDGQDHRVQVIDPNGNSTDSLYDGNHNVLRLTGADGNATTNLYDSLHRLVETIQSGCGITNKIFYDDEHHVVKTVDPEGHEVESIYHPNGMLHTVSDQDDNTTTFTYDLYGQPDVTTFPDTTTMDQDFSLRGDLMRSEDAQGNETFHTHDKRRLATSVTDDLGNTVSNVYDEAGMRVKTIDALGRETVFSFNAMEKPLSTTYADGYNITNLYDFNDRVVAVVDSMGMVSSNDLDLAGRSVRIYDALGRSISNRYDNAGNVLETIDPLLRSNSFVYDDLNRLMQTTNAMVKTSTSQFDAAGRRIALETFGGSDVAFNYDPRGFQTNMVSHEGRETFWQYNERGLLAETTEPSGEKTVTTYNSMGRATQVDFKTVAGLTVSTHTFDHDDNGNLVEFIEGSRTTACSYDSLNRLTNVSYTVESGGVPLPGGGTGGSAPVEIGYAYNDNGLLSELVYPDGKTVQYRYDNRNRLKEVEDWESRTTTYFYDLRGRLTGILNPNGTSRTNIYDVAGQLLHIKDFDASGNMVCQYDLTYDDGGRIISEAARPVNMPYNPDDVDAVFDGDNRMATFNGQTLAFDADGNATSAPLDGETFASLAYDTRNRLQSADGVSYTYDPSGNRIAKTVAGGQDPGTTTYVVNPNASLSQVLVREKPDGSTTYYVYGLGLLYEETGSETRQYHTDLRGSTAVLTDGAGGVTDRFSYTPYGEMNWRSGTTDTPFLYNGKYGVQTDPNGLLHMRARYYSPTLRRFLTEDPSGFGGGMNFYAYANGNPLAFVDPYGLCADSTGSYQSPILQNASPYSISEAEHYQRTQRALAYEPLLLGSSFSGYSDFGAQLAENNAIDYVTAIPAAVAGEWLWGKTAGIFSKAPKMKTVLGNGADVAPFRGKSGYNVLDMDRTLPLDTRKAININWLDDAINRGDDLVLKTDPIKWDGFMRKIGKESFYNEVELPHLMKRGIIDKVILDY